MPEENISRRIEELRTELKVLLVRYHGRNNLRKSGVYPTIRVVAREIRACRAMKSKMMLKVLE
jgi:hypothetical protein